MPISQTEGYFENPWYHFLEEAMLFLLAWKWKLWEKAFSKVKTKTNLSFAVKGTVRSNHSFLLSIWWVTFLRHLYNNRIKRMYDNGLKELNWLCKQMKTSEAVNLVLQWIFVLNKFSKEQVLPCEYR